MKRRSYQTGFIQVRDGKLTLRWMERDSNARRGWRERRETLPAGTPRKEAARLLADRVKTINEGAVPIASGPTLSSFIAGDWARYLASRGVKPSTRAGYSSMLSVHILPALGARSITSITPADISALMDSMTRSSSKHRLNLYALLRLVFDLAADLSLIVKSPVRRKVHRPQYQRPEKFALTAAQVQSLLAEIPEQWRALFETVSHTGMRAGEALGLRWCDIDLEGGVLHVRNALWRDRLQSPKTKRSVRDFVLTPGLHQRLRQHFREAEYRSLEHFVFSPGGGVCGDPDMLRRDVLYPALSRAGIELRPRASGFHLLRHTAATALVAAGHNLAAQTALGHATLTTTINHYAHASNVVDLETMVALEQALSAASR